jgi:nicotinamide-nucleotide amidase
MADLAAELGRALQAAGLSVVTAESCTGGWIGKRITDVPGSSAWFDRGFITYSNAAKIEQLGVDPALLAAHGAVSRETVAAMAAGALERSRADLAVAVTGVAGPAGGSEDKPIGTVWIAWQRRDETPHLECRQFSGDRENVRRATVQAALAGLIRAVTGVAPDRTAR